VYDNDVISQEEMFLLLESFLKTKLHLVEKEILAVSTTLVYKQSLSFIASDPVFLVIRALLTWTPFVTTKHF